MIEDLTVPELKPLLRERGLKVSGRKRDLVARLRNHPDYADNWSSDNQKAAPVEVLPAVPEEDRENIQREAASVVETASEITVRSEEDYEEAAAFLREVIRTGLAKIDEVFDKNIKRWYQGHRAAIADKKREQRPWKEAEKLVNDAMDAWEQELERRQAEERKALEASHKAAAEDEALMQVAELVAKGKNAEAERILARLEGGEIEPATPAPPVRAVKPAAAEGVSTRKLPRFEIVDVSKIKREFLRPDTTKIQKVVSAMGKDAEEHVGGIRYYEQRSRAVRR